MMEDLTYAGNADMHYMYNRTNGEGRAALRMYQAHFSDRRMLDRRILQQCAHLPECNVWGGMVWACFLNEDGVSRQDKVVRQHPKRGRFLRQGKAMRQPPKMRMVSKDRVKVNGYNKNVSFQGQDDFQDRVRSQKRRQRYMDTVKM
ncbi:hypothetical protein TNCV_641 [Trichonephila clavipes]|nr:hypothetical protein TNCV_641 [Trichonephila clavipes]